MCGILGIVAPAGRRPSLDDHAVAALRDRMTHRGPDGAGLWRHENCVLAHRRLAVIDPTDAGAQPMVALAPDGRPHIALVYNGELYNDAQLRATLRAGAPFASNCDTETILRAWTRSAHNTLPQLRGMYALGAWDARSRTLTLARDPLGIKPLYYARTTRGAEEIVFASDPAVVAAHPGVGARPNWHMVSAYLTTIRTVLGDQTMYAGVHALRPGEAIAFDCAGDTITERRWSHWHATAIDADDRWTDEAAADAVRTALDDATLAHLRADVPTCALLSGGLDSTALASIARRAKPDLRTYCAGAREGAGAEDDDLDVARRAAAFLDTRHEEALVTRASFAKRWPEMIGRLGVPLSTPNEVAIHDVAARLRADGCVVTLSGEGADELFAGYDVALRSALAYRAAAAQGEDTRGPGAFELESNAWIGPSLKAGVVREDILRNAKWDTWLARWYEDEFTAAADDLGAAAGADHTELAAHLRFVRRVNLTGLLQRLDTSTMLASVEGRVPFADARVVECAERLPMSVKLRAATAPVGQASSAPPTADPLGLLDADGPWETKACLRRAFAGDLPPEVLARPKRSFPLPFREWVEDSTDALRDSPLAREVFREEAVALVCAKPRELWNLAWPMVNLAMWGRAFD